MDLISQFFQSQHSKIKKALLYTVEMICDYSFDDQLLMKYSENISHVFKVYLEDQDSEVITRSRYIEAHDMNLITKKIK